VIVLSQALLRTIARRAVKNLQERKSREGNRTPCTPPSPSASTGFMVGLLTDQAIIQSKICLTFDPPTYIQGLGRRLRAGSKDSLASSPGILVLMRSRPEVYLKIASLAERMSCFRDLSTQRRCARMALESNIARAIWRSLEVSLSCFAET